MAYKFRFDVIDNVSAIGSRITGVFGRMRQSAQGFALAVNDGSKAVDRLGDEGRELNSAFGTLRNLGATLGIGAAVKTASDYGDRLSTANGLVATLTRNLDNTAAAQRMALGLSNETGASYAQMLDGLGKMLTLTDGNVEGASRLSKLAAGLAALNPSEGFDGALFALKELESGDNMSLRERFNIKVPTGSEAKKIAERDGKTVKQVLVESLQNYIDGTFGQGEGTGVDALLKIKANTIGGQVAQIGNSFRNIFTPMLLPFLEQTRNWLQEGNQWLSANRDTLRGLGSAFLEVLPRAAALFGIWQGFRVLSDLWGIATVGVHSFAGGLMAAGRWIAVAGTGLLGLIQRTAVWGFQSLLASGQAVRGMIGYVASLWATRPPMASMLVMVQGLWTRTMAWLASASMGVWRYAGTILTGAIPAMWGYVSTLNFAAIGQTVLNTLMLANPVGLIIAGVLALTAVFYGLFKLIDNLFPGFFAGVKEWFGKAWDFIYNTFIAPVVKFFKWLGDLTGITAAFKSGASPDASGGLPSDQENASLFKTLGLGGDGNGRLGSFGGGGKGGGIGVNDKVASVSGGGEVKHITINIKSLVENMVFQTEKGLADISGRVRSEVERALLNAVNNVNYAV